MLRSPTLTLPPMFILGSLPLVSFQIARVKGFVAMPLLSFDIFELDNSRPRRPVQCLLCLSANQIQPSSI